MYFDFAEVRANYDIIFNTPLDPMTFKLLMHKLLGNNFNSDFVLFIYSY